MIYLYVSSIFHDNVLIDWEMLFKSWDSEQSWVSIKIHSLKYDEHNLHCHIHNKAQVCLVTPHATLCKWSV